MTVPCALSNSYLLRVLLSHPEFQSHRSLAKDSMTVMTGKQRRDLWDVRNAKIGPGAQPGICTASFRGQSFHFVRRVIRCYKPVEEMSGSNFQSRKQSTIKPSSAPPDTDTGPKFSKSPHPPTFAHPNR